MNSRESRPQPNSDSQKTFERQRKSETLALELERERETTKASWSSHGKWESVSSDCYFSDETGSQGEMERENESYL